jgi:hypothetical protein
MELKNKFLMSLLATAVLTGCLSGDDKNKVPTANAGQDQMVDYASTVTLSGSGTDEDGTISSYEWNQTAGETIVITNGNTKTPSFLAPTIADDTTITLTLIVTDNDGDTATDAVDIVVDSPEDPLITLQGTATFEEQSSATVTATIESEVDVAAIEWTQISGVALELANITTSTVSIQTPAVDEDSEAILEISVTDVVGQVSTAQVTVQVTAAASLSLQGKVTDKVIPNADVCIHLIKADGSESPEPRCTTANGSGEYTLDIDFPGNTADDMMKLTAQGTGDYSQVYFESVLQSGALLLAAADSEGNGDTTLTSDEAFGVNVTNVSTAQAILLQLENGGTILTNDALHSAQAQLDPQKVLDIAIAIKIIVDNSDFELPDGYANTLEFAQSVEGVAEFLQSVTESNPDLVQEVMIEIAQDSDLVESIDDQLPSFIVGLGLFILDLGDTTEPEGEGQIITSYGSRAITWSQTEDGINVSLLDTFGNGFDVGRSSVIDNWGSSVSATKYLTSINLHLIASNTNHDDWIQVSDGYKQTEAGDRFDFTESEAFKGLKSGAFTSNNASEINGNYTGHLPFYAKVPQANNADSVLYAESYLLNSDGSGTSSGTEDNLNWTTLSTNTWNDGALKIDLVSDIALFDVTYLQLAPDYKDHFTTHVVVSNVASDERAASLYLGAGQFIKHGEALTKTDAYGRFELIYDLDSTSSDEFIAYHFFPDGYGRVSWDDLDANGDTVLKNARISQWSFDEENNEIVSTAYRILGSTAPAAPNLSLASCIGKSDYGYCWKYDIRFKRISVDENGLWKMLRTYTITEHKMEDNITVETWRWANVMIQTARKPVFDFENQMQNQGTILLDSSSMEDSNSRSSAGDVMWRWNDDTVTLWNDEEHTGEVETVTPGYAYVNMNDYRNNSWIEDGDVTVTQYLEGYHLIPYISEYAGDVHGTDAEYIAMYNQYRNEYSDGRDSRTVISSAFITKPKSELNDFELASSEAFFNVHPGPGDGSGIKALITFNQDGTITSDVELDFNLTYEVDNGVLVIHYANAEVEFSELLYPVSSSDEHVRFISYTQDDQGVLSRVGRKVAYFVDPLAPTLDEVFEGTGKTTVTLENKEAGYSLIHERDSFNPVGNFGLQFSDSGTGGQMSKSNQDMRDAGIVGSPDGYDDKMIWTNFSDSHVQFAWSYDEEQNIVIASYLAAFDTDLNFMGYQNNREACEGYTHCIEWRRRHFQIIGHEEGYVIGYVKQWINTKLLFEWTDNGIEGMDWSEVQPSGYIANWHYEDDSVQRQQMSVVTKKPIAKARLTEYTARALSPRAKDLVKDRAEEKAKSRFLKLEAKHLPVQKMAAEKPSLPLSVSKMKETDDMLN